MKLDITLGEQTVLAEAPHNRIPTPLPPYPSIFIGAKGVKPIEIIGAYTAFATLGTRAEPVGILRVEDRQGNILWQPAIRRETVIDSSHAWLMVDMMKDVIRRGTAFTAVWKGGLTLPACGTGIGSIPAPSRRRPARSTSPSGRACRRDGGCRVSGARCRGWAGLTPDTRHLTPDT